ncbi:replication-relaxation family protein [Bacillus alkalicellulosilyticus]|uniref:replication-relaxation family protein n=1 Tax=Alkalihalobacterium alkalicellulosilyticum TaxID=1912214 RepID=UPI00099642BE|nr:replication-relaxation family protein [Bacillus alkalicellulosilyticus]
MNVDSKKKRYKFGPNNQGAMLSNNDLKLLQFLANQRLLTVNQLYKVYKDKITINSFRVKLYRWGMKELIVPHQYSLGQDGFYFNYFRIGYRAVEILIREGMLPNSWEGFQIKKISNVKNVDHFLATQELVVNTIHALEEKEKNLESLHPYENPYLDNEEIEPSKIIIPDWILRVENRYLNIELDTGEEPTKEIFEKVERYAKLCKQNSHQEHVVLIAILDGSFKTRKAYSEDRSRRIGNLKKMFMSYKDLSLSNFSIYILPLSRAVRTAERVLLGLKPYAANIYQTELDTIELAVFKNPKFRYKYKEIESTEVYLPDVPKEMYADKAIKITHKKGSYDEMLLLVLLDEGNVKELDRLHYLSSMVNEGRMKQTIHKIIAFYSRRDEKIYDVLANHYRNVLIGDNESWMRTGYDETPKFSRTVSPFKMEVTEYDKETNVIT